MAIHPFSLNLPLCCHIFQSPIGSEISCYSQTFRDHFTQLNDAVVVEGSRLFPYFLPYYFHPKKVKLQFLPETISILKEIGVKSFLLYLQVI